MMAGFLKDRPGFHPAVTYEAQDGPRPALVFPYPDWCFALDANIG